LVFFVFSELSLCFALTFYEKKDIIINGRYFHGIHSHNMYERHGHKK